MHTNTHSPAITEHKITAFSPCLPAEEKQIVTSPAPANPSPAGFLPDLHAASGDGTLFSPHHPVNLWGWKLRETWQNSWAPVTKNLSSSCTQSSLIWARRRSGVSGSMTPPPTTAPLPRAIYWRRRRAEEVCAAPAAPAAARTEHTAAALHLELHLHLPAQNQYHAYGTAGGEKTCGAARGMAGWNFPSELTACPHTGLKSAPYVIEKFSLQVFKQTSHFSKCQNHQLQRGSCVSAEINFALLTKAMWRAKQGHMRGASVLISWFPQ